MDSKNDEFVKGIRYLLSDMSILVIYLKFHRGGIPFKHTRNFPLVNSVVLGFSSRQVLLLPECTPPTNYYKSPTWDGKSSSKPPWPLASKWVHASRVYLHFWAKNLRSLEPRCFESRVGPTQFFVEWNISLQGAANLRIGQLHKGIKVWVPRLVPWNPGCQKWPSHEFFLKCHGWEGFGYPKVWQVYSWVISKVRKRNPWNRWVISSQNVTHLIFDFRFNIDL